MALYRCAACGSPRVTTDTQEKSGGYSFKKGALGAFLFGTGGAVAGINGKTQIETIYKCPDCGLTLNHCMGSYEKREIRQSARQAGMSADNLEDVFLAIVDQDNAARKQRAKL